MQIDKIRSCNCSNTYFQMKPKPEPTLMSSVVRSGRSEYGSVTFPAEGIMEMMKELFIKIGNKFKKNKQTKV